MKIVATVDSENCLIQVSRSEFEAITGMSYYDSNNVVRKIFAGESKGDYNVIEPIEAVKNLKGIPKEVSQLKQNLEKLLANVIEYQKQIKHLPALSVKKVQD